MLCSKALKCQPDALFCRHCVVHHVRTHVGGELAGADDLEEPDPALGAGHHLLPEQVPGAEVLDQSEVSIVAS